MAMIRASPVTGLSLVPRPYSSSSSSISSNRVVMLRRTPFVNGGAGYLRLSVPTTRPNRCICRGALGTRMNLFNRFARVVKSYVSSILSSFEDPAKIIEQAVLEMNDDLAKMRQATAQALAAQKRLETKQKAAQQASEDWYRRAQLSLEKGDEDLAREALKRRKSYADNATSLKAELDRHNKVVDTLVPNMKLLESKIQEAKLKKDNLIFRYQSAEFATKVSGMLGNLNASSALSAFDKMEEKVMVIESQAEALNQLTTDDLEAKFACLESSTDDDLANLKKEMSGRGRKELLPPGRSAVIVIDAEIETELDESKKKASKY
ncbi:probable membrane-associated 30 kDa protein, chloroplastic [Papaver somniferum]|uniref:probable membrane-associated 30 kDa protein, chloroplastic n=1 Tax=Papaver somniferum TaxID=3469 RepID=UPI000E6FAAE5|nr:probable membrane-associated 30 kDa protein, chloroplastic [Papaver somniferum]